MAVFSFSCDEADIFKVRKAIFRMVLSRAAAHLTGPSDVEAIRLAELGEGVIFDQIEDPHQRTRLVRALLEGTEELRQQVAAGKPTEEPVLLGAEELLGELVNFLGSHVPVDG